MTSITRLALALALLPVGYVGSCVTLPFDIALSIRRSNREAARTWEHPAQLRREGRGGGDPGWSSARDEEWLGHRAPASARRWEEAGDDSGDE
jgi:hypothetical protein